MGCGDRNDGKVGEMRVSGEGVGENGQNGAGSEMAAIEES